MLGVCANCIGSAASGGETDAFRASTAAREPILPSPFVPFRVAGAALVKLQLATVDLALPTRYFTRSTPKLDCNFHSPHPIRTLHPTLYAPHSTLYNISHFALHTSPSSLHIPQFTLYTILYITLHSAFYTLHPALPTFPTAHSTVYTPLIHATHSWFKEGSE